MNMVQIFHLQFLTCTLRTKEQTAAGLAVEMKIYSQINFGGKTNFFIELQGSLTPSKILQLNPITGFEEHIKLF